MSSRTAGAWGARLVLAAALAGCWSGSGVPAARHRAPATPTVYAAIGASETVGIGTDDPIRDSFAQRLFQHLGPGSVFYDFAQPGETTEAALADELPGALAVHPDLATVWLNVDDMVAGVAVADYEARLDELVGGLRRAGVRRVLIANTPHLDHLPVYGECRPDPPAGSPPCPLGAVSLPPPAQVEALTQAYNAAIAAVAAREDATLVDLYAAGEVPDLHPDYVSQDGFHPSSAGAAAIAETFAAALNR